MTDFDETEGGEPEGMPGGPPDEPAIPHYDPLFASWDEAARAGQPPDDIDDSVAWLLGASATSWPTPLTAAAAYPDRYTPPYAGRIGELAASAQEGAIALPRAERKWLVTVRELAETVLLAVLIFMAVRASFQNFRVEGASMLPSLENGQHLIVNKLSYAEIDWSLFNFLPFVSADGNSINHLWDSPNRGDIVVFRAPTATNRDFIKRIIGLPGDTVEIVEGTGKVMVNGKPLAEPYIMGTTGCGVQCKWDVPAADSAKSSAQCGSNACYFVMGDNRENSSDSRQGWLVPEENIIGKALVTYCAPSTPAPCPGGGGPHADLAPNHSVAGEASAEE